MRIQHNIAALRAYRLLSNNYKIASKSIERLSSGYRINRAGDDAAGLAVSEKMRAQITGLKVAKRNAYDGISLIQTAEGALTEVHSMLNRIYDLAEQSANGTFDDEVDRKNLQKEVAALKDEISRIVKGTNFNGIQLLDGTLSEKATSVEQEIHGNLKTATIEGENSIDDNTQTTKRNYSKAGLTLQIGDTAGEENEIGVSIRNMGLDALGIEEVDVSTQEGGREAMDAIKNAINQVSSVRGDLGAIQNRLEHTINNLETSIVNLTDAESRIRDVDIAKEMMTYIKSTILIQSAQAMLAQANQYPQWILQLLR